MYPIYRFKLNYKDFLKMYIGDLSQIQSYLFLQTQPIEIEIHLEELLLSTNHLQFPELGMGEFVSKYRTSIFNLLTSIIGEVNREEGREYFKVLLNSSDEFLLELIQSYMTLIEKSLEIQKKLLVPINDKHSPITIVTNSIILNRLSTSLYEFVTRDKIPRSQMYYPEETNLPEVQLRNLNVDMIAITSDTNNHIIEYIAKDEELNSYLLVYNSNNYNYKNSIKGGQYLNAISTIAIYESILKENRALGWKNDIQTNLYLPYFNSPSRQVKADWSGEMLRVPSTI